MLLGLAVAIALPASSAARGGGKARPQPKITVGFFHVPPGRHGRHGQGPRPYDTCSQNCSFPEGVIGLQVSITDSPCDGSYSFDVDPGDGTGLITGIPITGTCDTSQNPPVFTGSGSTSHQYTDESQGALSVVFYVHDPDVGVIPLTPISLTVTEGDSLVGRGINISVRPGVEFTKALATFTDTPANGYTAPASDMFPTVDWGDGSPFGSTLDGTVSASASGGTFTITGTHTYSGTPPPPWLITIKLEDDKPGTAVNQAFAKASVRTFTAKPTSDVNGGSSISYQGDGFDSSGSQIVVSWDNLVDPVQTTMFAPATGFSGTQTATFGHPITDFATACTGKLTATQDGATDTIPVSGDKNQVILAARNLVRLENGQPVPLQLPDFACAGEQFGGTQQPVDVLTDAVRDGYQFSPGFEANIAVMDFPGSGADDLTVPISGYVNNGTEPLHGLIRLARGATLCLPLSLSGGPPTRGSMTAPASPQGSFPPGQIGKSCLSTAPNGTGANVVEQYGGSCSATIPPGTHTGDLNLDGGISCVKGSLTITGSLHLTGAILQVTGNLIIKHEIAGVGHLTVNGGTVINGSFANWQTDAFDLIDAGGDIYLLHN